MDPQSGDSQPGPREVHCTDLENKSLVRDRVGLLFVKPAQNQELGASPNPAAFTSGWSQRGRKLAKSKPGSAGSMSSPVFRCPPRPPQPGTLWSYRWKTSGSRQVCKYQSTRKKMAETREGSLHGSELCPAIAVRLSSPTPLSCQAAAGEGGDHMAPPLRKERTAESGSSPPSSPPRPSLPREHGGTRRPVSERGGETAR